MALTACPSPRHSGILPDAGNNDNDGPSDLLTNVDHNTADHPDAGTMDTGMVDTSVVDTSTTDSGAADTVADTGAAEDGPGADQGTGMVLKLELVAGQLGGPGNIDGIGATARFNNASGIALDGKGNAFVADRGNHLVRQIDLSTGAVSSIAGRAGVAGFLNGSGATAIFNSPSSIVYDVAGFLYIVDSGNNEIRRFALSTGQVDTLAGGGVGSADGTGGSASFNGPEAIAFDGAQLYVTDSLNNTIRTVTVAGVTATLAGVAGMSGTVNGMGSTVRFNHPVGLTLDGAGNLFVAESGAIRKIVLATKAVSTLGTLTVNDLAYDGTLYAIAGVAPAELFTVDPASGTSGNTFTVRCSSDGFVPNLRMRFDRGLYLLGNEIQVFDPSKTTLTPLAGASLHLYDSVDCPDVDQLYHPKSMAADGHGKVFVADDISGGLDSVDLATGTIAHDVEAPCFAVAQGGTMALTYESGGVIAACVSNNTIMNGSGTLIAGSANVAGSTDGTGGTALFKNPKALVGDGLGSVYVADSGNHTIRKVVVSSGIVTTIAGTPGSPGATDGTASAASFNAPSGIALDGQGNLYVADTGNHLVRKIALATKIVTTIAGSVAMTGTVDGVGATARFSGPTGVTVDGSGALIVADGNLVRRVVLPAGEVTTWVGVAGKVGVALGDLPAGLNQVGGVLALSTGEVVITDTVENAVLIVR
jgi:sugar lactone lactonase YvrE